MQANHRNSAKIGRVRLVRRVCIQLLDNRIQAFIPSQEDGLKVVEKLTMSIHRTSPQQCQMFDLDEAEGEAEVLNIDSNKHLYRWKWLNQHNWRMDT